MEQQRKRQYEDIQRQLNGSKTDEALRSMLELQMETLEWLHKEREERKEHEEKMLPLYDAYKTGNQVARYIKFWGAVVIALGAIGGAVAKFGSQIINVFK